jgi:hypothetical protein
LANKIEQCLTLKNKGQPNDQTQTQTIKPV